MSKAKDKNISDECVYSCIELLNLNKKQIKVVKFLYISGKSMIKFVNKKDNEYMDKVKKNVEIFSKDINRLVKERKGIELKRSKLIELLDKSTTDIDNINIKVDVCNRQIKHINEEILNIQEQCKLELDNTAKLKSMRVIDKMVEKGAEGIGIGIGAGLVGLAGAGLGYMKIKSCLIENDYIDEVAENELNFIIEDELYL